MSQIVECLFCRVPQRCDIKNIKDGATTEIKCVSCRQRFVAEAFESFFISARCLEGEHDWKDSTREWSYCKRCYLVEKQ